MAQNRPKVLLGFQDELINEKYKTNFTTNKMGGLPDLPTNLKFDHPRCALCNFLKPLVLQIYAPLDNSVYHRTLYLFACINPNCLNLSESWTCLRIQTQEKLTEEVTSTEEQTPKASVFFVPDWEDDAANDAYNKITEENGNLINIDRMSDEDDDESCSFEESIRSGLGNLTVDDRNANNGALGGAVGRLSSPSATAEIEVDESEVVSVDTPTFPQHDLIALLQEVAPLPPDLCHNTQSGQKKPQFIPYFINVWEEESPNCNWIVSDGHVKDLLQDYQKYNETDLNLSPGSGGASAQINDNYEKYEKTNPVHGDRMFHEFASRIQKNPGQLLRYIRETESPLLLYPLKECPQKCPYCQGELTFELQVLPTIISKLRLESDEKNEERLEFGTILVLTCRKSCWSTDTNVRFENVILQIDRVNLF